MIIGLVGFKQVGKSTAASYLEEQFGFERINMKDALVAEIKNNFPRLLQAIADYLSENGVEEWNVDRLFAEKPPIMRALLQEYGTEVRRGDKDSYWTDEWCKAVAQSLAENIVVDDVRFLNEAEAVRARGGIIVRITRPDVATGGTHASETEQLSIVADYTIDVGKGDIGALHEELNHIFQTEQG